MTHTCECGAVCALTPTASPWVFDWRCPCGFAGVVAYAEHLPPPIEQPLLF